MQNTVTDKANDFPQLNLKSASKKSVKFSQQIIIIKCKQHKYSFCLELLVQQMTNELQAKATGICRHQATYAVFCGMHTWCHRIQQQTVCCNIEYRKPQKFLLLSMTQHFSIYQWTYHHDLTIQPVYPLQIGQLTIFKSQLMKLL